MTSFYITTKKPNFFSQLTGFHERMVMRILRAVQQLSLEVQRSVKEEKLTGQVLNVRTGTLRRSINREVTMKTDRVRAIVGTNVWYGAVHEYGAHIPAVSGTLMVFPVPNLPGDFLTSTGALKKRFQRQRELLIFTMKRRAFDLPERSFLRSTLEEYKPEIERRLTDAMVEAIGR